MKILVTGGAGFIASHVVDLYISQGHTVTVVDDLSTGVKENLNSKANFIQADIRSPDMHKILQTEKPEAINHHAAHIHVGRSVEDPAHDADINIIGLINLMQAAEKVGSVKKVIFSSTGGAMYGDQPTPFSETLMPAPLSPYGVSKRSGELYLNFYYHQHGIPYIALRYANVYGPRQNPHGEAGVVSIFCEKLLSGQQPVINGDGQQTRDYVFVSDVAQANLLALESTYVGEINIGTAIETDVNTIYHLVSKSFQPSVTAQHGPPRPGEQTTSSLNYSRAQQELAWKPSVSLEQGIADTVAFFKSKVNS